MADQQPAFALVADIYSKVCKLLSVELSGIVIDVLIANCIEQGDLVQHPRFIDRIFLLQVQLLCRDFAVRTTPF